MSLGFKLTIILLLAAVDVYVIYLFQHYFGINGSEWFAFFGFLVARQVLNQIGDEVGKA